jgi:predicted CXXCH cytochrome family protein
MKFRLALAGVLAGLALAAWGAPVIEKARSGPCVDLPEVMRRQHPELLKHQRNETVHRGVRDARASLKGCIDCHASAGSNSVASAKNDFCVSCHSFAAVKVDCFECHASKPKAL